MKRLLPTLLLLLIAFAARPERAAAQRIVAKVTVTLAKLPQENQNKLQGLDRVIEAYINQRDWAPDDYGYDVPLDLDIYFDAVMALSFEDRYTAEVVVSNRSNMQYSDKRWQFPLEPGVQLNYTDSFDPFRSMIDYYVFMTLGYEFDKVKKFGGTPYFENARTIAQQARFSSRYYLGWDKREEWVNNLLKPENEQIRYLNFLYYTGEWLFYDQRDKETAKQYLLYAVKQFPKIPTDKLKRFFDLNYYNYANALAEYQEYSALSKMAAADPNPDHTIFYQKLLKNH